tara:strand:- start:350 stop:574 length:225 start_codon:yes stop_codon:yes gene_type:complete
MFPDLYRKGRGIRNSSARKAFGAKWGWYGSARNIAKASGETLDEVLNWPLMKALVWLDYDAGENDVINQESKNK